MGCADTLSHALFAYTHIRALKKYGATHTRKLLVLIAKDCNYRMFAKLEDYFQYRFVGDPEDLFKNAIKGNNCSFIHDYLDNKRFEVTRYWYDSYYALPKYMMRALGKWAPFESYILLRKRLMQHNYMMPVISNALESATLRAINSSNYTFIRDSIKYIVENISNGDQIKNKLYNEAIFSHDLHVLEILDAQFNSSREYILEIVSKRTAYEHILVKNMAATLNLDIIQQLEARGITLCKTDIVFNAVKFGNIPLLDYALTQGGTMYFSFGWGGIFEIISNNASLNAFKHFCEHPNVEISDDRISIMSNVSRKPYFPKLIDYLIETKQTKLSLEGAHCHPSNIYNLCSKLLPFKSYASWFLYQIINYGEREMLGPHLDVVKQYIPTEKHMFDMDITDSRVAAVLPALLYHRMVDPVKIFTIWTYNEEIGPNSVMLNLIYSCIKWMRRTKSAQELMDYLRSLSSNEINRFLDRILDYPGSKPYKCYNYPLNTIYHTEIRTLLTM
jgi:hypothetical protein